MDPLDFFEEGQLLEFLHRNKTEISIMGNPRTFIMQLRDHNLIREDKYKKLIRMKKDNMNGGLYEELDWLEQHTPQHIRLFWECVFKESILSRYPKLLMLRNSLMDGSFQFCKLPQKVEKEEKKEALKGGEEEEEEEEEEGTRERKRGKKQRKRQRSGSVPGEEEQPGTSSSSIPAQRKRKKPTYSSPLKKGDKKDIWTWALYKVQIPVTCGDKEGVLNRAKLAKGEKCIVVKNQWFTPSGFEEYGGRKAYKNWKLSIRCMNTPLSKLLQDGHLTCQGYKRTRTKRSLFPPIELEDSDTVSSSASDSGLENERDEDDEEDLTDAEKDASHSRASPTNATAFVPMASTSTQTAVPSTIKQEVNQEGHTGKGDQEEPGPSGHDTVDKRVFNVKCGAMNGTLHKHRFASGTCGKSIRTDERWFSPVEFVREALEQPDAPWKKEIQWEGLAFTRPLSVLIGETKALRIHSVLCKCSLCRPEDKDLEDQENDDECFICRSDRQEEVEWVVCDGCPRTFHQRCHLPNVEDKQLRDGHKWYCTFCVWKMYDYHEQSTHIKVLSSQISRHLLECQYLLLALYREDMDKCFTTDPAIHVRNYTTVVKFPMWLDKVAENLQQNRYQTVSQFVCDVLHIFTNCAKFNRDNAEFRDLGNSLKELFDSEFAKVFRIQQDNAQ